MSEVIDLIAQEVQEQTKLQPRRKVYNSPPNAVGPPYTYAYYEIIGHDILFGLGRYEPNLCDLIIVSGPGRENELRWIMQNERLFHAAVTQGGTMLDVERFVFKLCDPDSIEQIINKLRELTEE